jgi:molecular chaperone GrpE (heat shock protein)
MVYIPRHLTAGVAKEASRYRRLRRARAMLAKLAGESLQVIDKLERALETTEEIGAGERKRASRCVKAPGKRV